VKVLLVYTGLKPGGITSEIRLLEHGLRSRGVEVAAAGDIASVNRHTRSGDPLVHVFSCVPSAVTAATMAMARARRLPLVWSPIIHPNRMHSWRGYGLIRVAMSVFDRVAPQAARFVDGVITATEAEQDFFQRAGARRVELIRPPVDKTTARPEGEALARVRASFGIGDEPTVLFVARPGSSRRKGVPFARAAFRELRQRMPAARLMLLGQDADSDLAGEPGAVPTGWVSLERVADVYDAADVLLVASVYECLPRAVIEAWSHEMPVAVTEGIALAPLVRGRAGIVAPYGDVPAMASAMETILADPALGRAYGRAGRALVDDGFLLSDYLSHTLEFYGTVGAS
jgi:glycosyltransferase involved in cell wall biosynthesis